MIQLNYSLPLLLRHRTMYIVKVVDLGLFLLPPSLTEKLRAFNFVCKDRNKSGLSRLSKSTFYLSSLLFAYLVVSFFLS